MSKKLIALLSGSLLLAVFVCLPVSGADKEEKKKSIKDVMKKVMKGKPSMLAKVVKEGSEKEKKELAVWLSALGKNKPKKGEAENWSKLTKAIDAAAKDFAEGKEGAAAKLQKATNCKACHKDHK